MNKIALGTMLILFTVSSLNLMFQFQSAKGSTIMVPDDYPTIQEAINSANPGDTIFIKSGVYYEHIIINRTVQLRGENSSTTIVDGNKTGTVAKVTSDNVNITGFTIRAGQNTHPICDIWLENVSRCKIYSNIFTNSFYGVYLNEANGNSIYGNLATNVSIGICGFHSDGNSVFRNKFIANSFAGINFHLCSFNNVIENLVSEGATAMRLLDGANNNSIYHNDFVNNVAQVYVQSSYNNVWDADHFSGGNYWDDYIGADADHDGIGDTPYLINSNNRDNYPLMNPYIAGDYNHDGIVNMTDADMVRSAWQSKAVDLNYNPHVDSNVDGVINIKDAAILGANWGKHA